MVGDEEFLKEKTESVMRNLQSWAAFVLDTEFFIDRIDISLEKKGEGMELVRCTRYLWNMISILHNKMISDSVPAEDQKGVLETVFALMKLFSEHRKALSKFIFENGKIVEIETAEMCNHPELMEKAQVTPKQDA